MNTLPSVIVSGIEGVLYGCAECARYRRAVRRALAVIARSAGGTVAEVKRILAEAANDPPPATEKRKIA
jgi:hypothetical protein